VYRRAVDDTLDVWLAPLMGPIGIVFAALWGAIWGSFFNLCIARIPERESIVRPASHCRACRVPLRWIDNVPIAGWLILRGRCRACGERFSIRYLVVELLSAALSVVLFLWIVALDGIGPLWFRLVAYLVHFFFAGTLIVLSFIDLATFLLPNAITFPAIPLFSLAALALGRPWLDVLIGAAAGYGFIRLLADAYFWLTKREGMGYGDAKLLALLGGFLGWQALGPTLFWAALQGSVVGITVGVMRRRAGAVESIRHLPIPFGPFLSLGALETMLVGDWIAWLLPL
jgi:leader peptidase (prepilin peptidase)/N-methyltransferase